MAGGLHHHHEIGGLTPVPSIRRVDLATSTAPDCEQAVGGETPLSTAPAACSLFPSLPLCGTCAGTPARRCCLTLAAQIIKPQSCGKKSETSFLRIEKPRCIGLSFAARMAAKAEGSKSQDLTAQTGGAA